MKTLLIVNQILFHDFKHKHGLESDEVIIAVIKLTKSKYLKYQVYQASCKMLLIFC